MNLRTRIVAHFVVLHLVLAGAGVLLLREDPALLFVVETGFLVSVLVGARLIKALFMPFDLIQTGAELIAERDFTSHFAETGLEEMDRLIAVYNAMIDRLRDERLSAEERHQLLTSIVEVSPSGIVICDFDGKFEQMNPAARRLLTAPLAAEMKSMAAGESRLVTDVGPRRVKISRAEFRDRGFAKSFFLIDEMTDELRLSERAAYEKLIRMMSHEVNNSVGAVRSLLESVLRYAEQIGPADREDFTTAVEVASSRMDSLNRFMGGFADVVRIPLPHRLPTDVRTIVSHVLTLLRPELEARSISVSVDAPDEIRVALDANQFEQVVLNVLRNAVEAIDRSGSIAIRVRPEALTVADSGHGIAPDLRGDLFTPFFTTKPSGRGLGLTIVQEILTNHGFSYSLISREEEGAEFRIGF